MQVTVGTSEGIICTYHADTKPSKGDFINANDKHYKVTSVVIYVSVHEQVDFAREDHIVAACDEIQP